MSADNPAACARNRHCGRPAPSDYNHGVVVDGRWYCDEACSLKPEAARTCKPWCGKHGKADACPNDAFCFGNRDTHWCSPDCSRAGKPMNPAPRPVAATRLCRGCGAQILDENVAIADQCPCNSGRGINHGIVSREICTCGTCDPVGTGSSRVILKSSPIVSGGLFALDEMRTCAHTPGKHPDNCDGEVESTRPVERSSQGDSLVIRGDGSGTYEFADGRKVEYPAYQPRPVERCSCEESKRYARALWEIIEATKGMSFAADRLADIARRALALGGET